MKRSIIHLFTLLALVTTMGSCKKQFNEFQVNNNQPVNVTPSLLLRSVLNDMVVKPFGQIERQCQFTCANYTYYDNNKYWDGSASLNYGTLNNVLAMEAQAAKIAGSGKTPYHALGKFFRAFFFVNMTMKVGDLPMKEALSGLNNPTPKYDTQKEIFKQSLMWLDSANAELAGFISNGFLEFSGDFYFTERLRSPLSPRDALINWQKVVNTYKLRVLIELSKKESDADLKVPQQFAAIINNPGGYPIFTKMEDNLQYEYNSAYNYYPNNTNNFGNDALRYNMAATWLNTLAATKDLRAMMIADPARGLGFADTAYQSFVGAPSGQDLSTMAGLTQAGKYSPIGRHRYYETLTGEPTFIISYPEMCFNIAEGINRGWVTGDAESWYIKGIKAMQSFYGVTEGANTVTFQRVGASSLGDDVSYTVHFYFNNFYNQPAVKYSGNNATGLTQILTQKYLAYARNSGMQAYYQWRRTGVPTFDVGPGSGNSSRIPKRFQYPVNELSTNPANLNAALQSQFGGSDDLFKDLWIVQ